MVAPSCFLSFYPHYRLFQYYRYRVVIFLHCFMSGTAQLQILFYAGETHYRAIGCGRMKGFLSAAFPPHHYAHPLALSCIAAPTGHGLHRRRPCPWQQPATRKLETSLPQPSPRGRCNCHRSHIATLAPFRS